MNNNENFIDPNKNDMFSYLRGTDLQQLLLIIENYKLTYRNKLYFSKTDTIGIELEYEGISKKIVDEYIAFNFPNWCSESDRSLTSGGEIKSPIITNKKNDWQELQQICRFLRNHKDNTFNNASTHIHCGAHTLGDDASNWRRYIKLIGCYESIMFRFSYGDKISGRKNINKFAPPISDKLCRDLKALNQANDIEKIKKYLEIVNEKYQSINFGNVKWNDICSTKNKNTIEIRIGNATSNEIICQNFINMNANVIDAGCDTNLDEEFLDYKFQHDRISSTTNSYLYNEICLKNALEFVDLVFTNNLDKIYFLKQYLKSFQDNYGIDVAVKSKQL